MKVLYESVVSPQTRHLLGGYYTPDCLAEEIIDNGVTDPLTQRVLERELRQRHLPVPCRSALPGGCGGRGQLRTLTPLRG